MVRLLQNEIFGRKSEVRPVIDPNQLQLFTPPEPVAPIQPDESIAIKGHARKKRGRKPLPEDLPRVEVVHDLPEEEKQCACGATLSRIGEETCEKLDYVPARVQVIRHIRPKYACKRCEGVEDDGPTVRIAPVPVQLIPKSMATEGLLAHIAVSKFADALPLYRQQKIFNRLGVELSRATLANWMIQAAMCCRPIIELLQQEIRSGPLINIDESPLQVLKEPGRSNTTKSFMWVFCGGPLSRPMVLYQYHPTRSGQLALGLLDGYQGYIQSDGYSGYDHLTGKLGHCPFGLSGARTAQVYGGGQGPQKGPRQAGGNQRPGRRSAGLYRCVVPYRKAGQAKRVVIRADPESAAARGQTDTGSIQNLAGGPSSPSSPEEPARQGDSIRIESMG